MSQDVYQPIGVDDVVASDVVFAGVAPTLQVAVDALIPFHLLRLSRRRRKIRRKFGRMCSPYRFVSCGDG